MQFQDDLAAGTVLVRPAFQSPDYDPGVSGWAVLIDGSAEFNNVTIRGATTTQGTSLMYDGTPAAGNLIGSIASEAGTDAYGNAYPVGITTYDRANLLFTNLQGGKVYWGQIVAGVVDIDDTGQIATDNVSHGLVLTSPNPAGTAFTDSVMQVWKSGLPTGTSGADNPTVEIRDVGGTAPVDVYLSGAMIKTTANGSAQTWQPVTAAMLGTGWAAGPSGGTVQSLQYRIDVQDNLILAGAVHTTSTTPASTIFTLPAGYRPKVTQRSPGVSNSGGTAAARYAEVSSSGNVAVGASLTTASTDVYFQVCVPLGNLG